MNMVSIWYRFIPMVLVMGIIFYLSHQSGDSLGLPDIPFFDKLIHALVYGVLAATVWYAVPRQIISVFPWRVWAGVVLFCLLYAISDEFHQSFIPGREPDAMDIVADMVGAVTVSLVHICLIRCQWHGGSPYR
jgi:VanZ family protein